MKKVMLALVLWLSVFSASASTINLPLTCTTQEETKIKLDRLGYNTNLGLEKISIAVVGEVWTTGFLNEESGQAVVFLLFEDGMCTLYTYQTAPVGLYERTN
jgi:hypothetical protein